MSKNFNNKWRFQKSLLKFDFTQDDNGWWTVDALHRVERSEDNINWEVASIPLQIIDKDYAKAIVTVYSIIGDIASECSGDLFNYKNSKFSQYELKREELKEKV